MIWNRLRHWIIGPAKDLHDPHITHKLSLIAFLAWVGLGADGLSSSAYGPEEAYRQLGNHTYLALPLFLAMATTVFIISYAYSRIIEHFPVGGGGYVVATQLLGKSAGVVSGSALLVDYILTITVSIAGGGDALFSLLPLSLHQYKLPTEYFAILLLILLNLRGVKESVTFLVPLFLIFVFSHLFLIGGGVVSHLLDLPQVVGEVQSGFSTGMAQVGGWGLFLIFLRAYSLGGGTYTGIEAVSNGIGIFREPKVETGKRTMLYMAISLAVTAAGLLLCFMLVDIVPVAGQTLNAALAYNLAGNITLYGAPVGSWFVMITMFSEALLLLVAAQTGFIDGPRVMSNMAIDSWLPRRFATLSDRLSMQNGVLLMGVASILLLGYTQGSIQTLVVMYSVNVFLTFSLSQMGMVRFWLRSRHTQPAWKRDIIIHGIGLILCLSILIVMIVEKFGQGAWITALITCLCIAICFAIRRHYRGVVSLIREVDKIFEDIPPEELLPKKVIPFDPKQPTAVILVNGYTGLGVHIFLTVLRQFREIFKNVVFMSVGVIDSSMFKAGGHYVEELENETKQALEHYVHLANDLGIPAETAYRIGTDVVDDASELCIELSKKYERPIFFAGEIVFHQPKWYHRLLHNYTPYAIQRRIRLAGLTLMILPMLDEKLKKAA
ncbi:MAG: APC family permease [Deltaproteobacteria bacterium]|nr:APC family permease [Deltaproteobacteria bacterium]